MTVITNDGLGHVKNTLQNWQHAKPVGEFHMSQASHASDGGWVISSHLAGCLCYLC